MLTQNEQVFFKIIKRKEESFFIPSCLVYTTFTKKRVLQGKNAWYRVMFGFFSSEKELQIIMTKNIPESDRLYVMVLVCARLYGFNLMETRKALFPLSLCLECSFFGYFFNKTDVLCVVWGRNSAHALRFSRVISTLGPGARPANMKS